MASIRRPMIFMALLHLHERVHSCMQGGIKKIAITVNNMKGRVVNYHGPCAHVLEMACDYERKALKTSVMRNQDWRGIFPLKIFDVKRPPEWRSQPNVFLLAHVCINGEDVNRLWHRGATIFIKKQQYCSINCTHTQHTLGPRKTGTWKEKPLVALALFFYKYSIHISQCVCDADVNQLRPEFNLKSEWV